MLFLRVNIMKLNKEILIVEAALHLFKEKGFAAVRIADIAQEAGVGKGTVYEYYSSKEELLVRACCYNCQKVGEDIGQILSRETQLSNPVKIVHKTLQIVLTKLLEKTTEENKLFYELSVLTATNAELKELVRADFQAKVKQWQDATLVDYQRGLDSGHFRYIEKPEDLAEFLVATVDGIMWQMQWQQTEKLKDQARRMVDVYCQLIMKTPHKLAEYLK